MKTLHALLSAILLLYLVETGTCGAIDLKPEASEDEAILMAKGGLFDKLFDTLISGYETVSQIILDMFEKGDDEGLLNSLYEKLKEELSKLKDKILGGKPVVAEEVEAARREVERLVEEHKRIHAYSKLIVEGALESAKNARLAQKIVNEGPDAIRHRIYEIDHALKEHVFDGAPSRIDLAQNDVNEEKRL